MYEVVTPIYKKYIDCIKENLRKKINDMDFNVNNNKVVAVGSDNNLYITNQPVAPFLFNFLNSSIKHTKNIE